VWLSPFYPSPQFDFGYDISDYCDVNPLFGTLQDFDQMVLQCHQRDIKVIVDFVPGHTSHRHPWFQKSVQREEPYTDYYVWHDGKTGDQGERIPPNNWLSVFSGPAWAWSEERGQFYYRPFLPEQPKLNFRSPRVVQEMKDVLRFWLDRGVDGVRMDAIADIMEAEDKTMDEPRSDKDEFTPEQHEYLDHIHTQMHPDGFPLVRQWRDVMKEYEAKDGHSRFMVIEIYGPPEGPRGRNVYRKFGGLPFNMDLTEELAQRGLGGLVVKELVDQEYRNLPVGGWPTFVIGNHDRRRVTTKYGREYGDALNMLLLTLKGTPTTYYGEELGMIDIEVSYEDTQDPFGKNMGPDRYLLYSRDGCRAPMQWDNSSQAGFTQSSRPWLPLHPEYPTHNVTTQESCEGLSSPLQVYKRLSSLRQAPAFTSGALHYAVCDTEIFSFVRIDERSGEKYLVAINFGTQSAISDLSGAPVSAASGAVEVTTSALSSRLSVGDKISLTDLPLTPGDGVVLKL